MEASSYRMELAGKAIECLAVAIMVVFIFMGTIEWLMHSAKNIEGAYERYRIVLGKTLLTGLVRTTQAWTLTVEAEGHWPWRRTTELGIGEKAP